MTITMITFLLFFSTLFLNGKDNNSIKLPEVKKDSDFSLEKALWQRRSIRDYAKKPLKLEDVGALLWAGQGITSPDGKRTSPSAGALYPIELYFVSFSVEGIESGVYKYNPFKHSLELIKKGDFKEALFNSALNQECIKNSNGVIVITAIFERTTIKYGERGKNYVYFEAGCVAENIHLMAERIGMGTVVVGAFYDNMVKKSIFLNEKEVPITLMPLGYKK